MRGTGRAGARACTSRPRPCWGSWPSSRPPPGAGDRVVRRRGRPDRPCHGGGHRPVLDLRLHRRPRAPPPQPGHGTARAPGAVGLPRRFRKGPHHRPLARPRLPGRNSDLGPPRHRVGPQQRRRGRAGTAPRMGRAAQDAPRPAALGSRRARRHHQPRPTARRSRVPRRPRGALQLSCSSTAWSGRRAAWCCPASSRDPLPGGDRSLTRECPTAARRPGPSGLRLHGALLATVGVQAPYLPVDTLAVIHLRRRLLNLPPPLDCLPSTTRRETHDQPKSTPLVVALSTDDVSLVLDLSDRALPAVVHWGARLEGLESGDLARSSTRGWPSTAPTTSTSPAGSRSCPNSTGPGPAGRGCRARERAELEHPVRGRPGHPRRRAAAGQSHVGGPGLLEVARRRARRPRAAPRDRAGGGRPGAAARHRDQHRRRPLHRRRADPGPATAGRPRRAARLRWPLGARTRPAAAGAAHRHPLAREPPGPHRRGQCARAARGHTGFRLRQRRHPRRPHRVERQPRPLRGEDLHRRDRARWRRAPAARRGADRHGESYSSPWVCFSSGPGLDVVARRFHRHLRARSRPVSTTRPVTLNVWEAVYFDHRLERLVDLAERAARVGVERYVLDDGWFGARRHDRAGLGDWVVSDEVWPEGLRPLIDRVTGLGMQFGLWFEPEMVNPDSDLARAHPDWMMAARDELPVASRHQQVLDLTVPGAYEHVKGQILALLAEYDIPYIKWDHNRDLVEAGSQPAGGRPAVHAQTLAVYRLLDELRAEHPDPGDRVLLVRWRPGRPRHPRADRPGLGVRRHRPAGAAAHAPVDHPADPSGVPGLAHRLRTAPTRPDAGTTCPSAPEQPSSDTSASSGTSPLSTRTSSPTSPSGSAFYKEHRHSCSAATSCGSTAATPTSWCTASSHPTGRKPCSPSPPWATRCTHPGRGCASPASTRRPGTGCGRWS